MCRLVKGNTQHTPTRPIGQQQRKRMKERIGYELWQWKEKKSRARNDRFFRRCLFFVTFVTLEVRCCWNLFRHVSFSSSLFFFTLNPDFWISRRMDVRREWKKALCVPN